VADGPPPEITLETSGSRARHTKRSWRSFFRVRLDGTTELQRAYLRAMAELGPAASEGTDVADIMSRPPTSDEPLALPVRR